MKNICDAYPISNSEYHALEIKFGQLTKYASWQLLKKNAKNNHTDDFDDINQELLMSMIRAGSYYKRQVYTEQCLIVSLEFIGTAEAMSFLQHLASKPQTYKCLSHEAGLAIERIKKRGKPFTASSSLLTSVLQELVILWHNRTRHGANRQKFGPQQEKLLRKVVNSIVPARERPDKKAPLRVDAKFETYCKAITWNSQKSMGRKITREKSIRTGQVSLSDFDYLVSVN